MIAVASSKAKEIIVHSLPRIGEGYRDRYWKKSRIVFSSSNHLKLSQLIENQSSEWFDILNKAIENDRCQHQNCRGPIVEFRSC